MSRNGGAEPVWRADGKELFYVAAGGTLTADPIHVAGEFAAGVPQTLFRIGAPVRALNSQTYAVAKEGHRGRRLANSMVCQLPSRSNRLP